MFEAGKDAATHFRCVLQACRRQSQTGWKRGVALTADTLEVVKERGSQRGKNDLLSAVTNGLGIDY